jgi:hypothetical protein
MAKLDFWWPWDKLIGREAEVSIAIGTWWVVIVTAVAALATLFGVLSAFLVQLRQLQYEQDRQVRERFEEALAVVIYIEDVSEQLDEVVAWLSEERRFGPAGMPSDWIEESFVRLSWVRAQQTAMEALVARPTLAVRWVRLTATILRFLAMAGRLLVLIGQEGRDVRGDRELPSLRSGVRSLRVEVYAGRHDLEAAPPPDPVPGLFGRRGRRRRPSSEGLR